jgi:hypothetical protein
MAKTVIHIQFPSPPPENLTLRAFNFIEDVYRLARDQGLGTIDDIDRYGSGLFVVRVSSSRHLGEMLSVIKKQLKHHMLEGDATVTRHRRSDA